MVGIPDPSRAFINAGVVGSGLGQDSIPLGAHFAASGCTKPGPVGVAGTQGLVMSGSERLATFSRLSSEYYVEIDEAKQPAVVSGRL